ncbi:hypothetical protein ACFWNR_39620 [Streptomyces virginiae]|uniref:hypothetical protein n=1 Tax=Streptomyces virginiae TaxID=1961 RepID=UPI0036556088
MPGDTADHEDQAAVLHALYDDRNRSAGVLGMISDLLTGTGVRIEDQGGEGGEGITEVIDEAAAYVQDSAGQRLEWARTVLLALEASYGSPRGPPAPSATAGPTAPPGRPAARPLLCEPRGGFGGTVESALQPFEGRPVGLPGSERGSRPRAGQQVNRRAGTP